MKNKIAITLILCLTIVAACKKTGVPNGGSWTFKSQTYNSTFTDFVRDALTAYTGNNLPTGTLAFKWSHLAVIDTTRTWTHTPDSIYPRAGVYLLTDNENLNDSNYVYTYFTDHTPTNFYFPSKTTVPTITVTRNGKIVSVSIQSAEMVASTGDSGVLSGNITMTPR